MSTCLSFEGSITTRFSVPGGLGSQPRKGKGHKLQFTHITSDTLDDEMPYCIWYPRLPSELVLRVLLRLKVLFFRSLSPYQIAIVLICYRESC